MKCLQISKHTSSPLRPPSKAIIIGRTTMPMSRLAVEVKRMHAYHRLDKILNRVAEISKRIVGKQMERCHLAGEIE